MKCFSQVGMELLLGQSIFDYSTFFSRNRIWTNNPGIGAIESSRDQLQIVKIWFVMLQRAALWPRFISSLMLVWSWFAWRKTLPDTITFSVCYLRQINEMQTTLVCQFEVTMSTVEFMSVCCVVSLNAIWTLNWYLQIVSMKMSAVFW